jgi:hypothetical protein
MEKEIKRKRRKKKVKEDPNKVHGNSHIVPIKEIPKDGTIKKRSEYLYDRKLHPIIIESMIMNGFNYSQICEKLGVPTSVFSYWKRTHPEIKEAIKRGKLPADEKVEHSLFKVATGYTYEEVTLEPKALTPEEIRMRAELLDPPPVPMVKKKVVRKQVAPNVLAQIFYLKNRRPETWKDRSNVAVSGKVEYEVTLPPRPEDIKKAGQMKVGEVKVEMIEDKSTEAIQEALPSEKEISKKVSKIGRKTVLDKDVNIKALINDELNLDDIKDGFFG